MLSSIQRPASLFFLCALCLFAAVPSGFSYTNNVAPVIAGVLVPEGRLESKNGRYIVTGKDGLQKLAITPIASGYLVTAKDGTARIAREVSPGRVTLDGRPTAIRDSLGWRSVSNRVTIGGPRGYRSVPTA
jgi:hypothetical protein